mmetsp:Transcript_61837/g.100047  ORF Transcript_61837/g.100047 Transcript_61837/m.100047 type:complete len:92 (+) Transcript_61837:144-419(+)
MHCPSSDANPNCRLFFFSSYKNKISPIAHQTANSNLSKDGSLSCISFFSAFAHLYTNNNTRLDKNLSALAISFAQRREHDAHFLHRCPHLF